MHSTEEIERTYLAKRIPDLSTATIVELFDIYIPNTVTHTLLRLRKKNDQYEITRKYPSDDGDASRHTEIEPQLKTFGYIPLW